MNRYSHLLTTLILGSLLVPPFLLKMLAASLEPYPAVILPAGAHQVELTNSRVNFTRTRLWGKKLATNSWTGIDSEKLLKPIPHEYLGHLVSNSFGLEIAKKNVNSKFKQMFIAMLRGKVTTDEINQTKQWLGKQLVQQNCDSGQFKVTEEEVVFDVSTGKIVSRKIKNERVFRLD